MTNQVSLRRTVSGLKSYVASSSPTVFKSEISCVSGCWSRSSQGKFEVILNKFKSSVTNSLWEVRSHIFFDRLKSSLKSDSISDEGRSTLKSFATSPRKVSRPLRHGQVNSTQVQKWSQVIPIKSSLESSKRSKSIINLNNDRLKSRPKSLMPNQVSSHVWQVQVNA